MIQRDMQAATAEIKQKYPSNLNRLCSTLSRTSSFSWGMNNTQVPLMQSCSLLNLPRDAVDALRPSAVTATGLVIPQIFAFAREEAWQES